MTLLNGGKVREKYMTWDRTDLEISAVMKVETTLQDNLLRQSLGDSEFERLSLDERRDMRDQLHSFKREIESLGAIVDEDRLARLFNNAIIQGNHDRILDTISREENSGADTETASTMDLIVSL